MIICRFLVALMFALVQGCAHAYPLAEAIQKLDKDIQAHVKRGKIPGCAIAIVDKGALVFIKAYGVRKKDEKAPIDLDTVFQLGSISKPITATLVAILQKKGILSVEREVKDLLPFINPTTRLAHILGHTTGYSSAGWNQKIENHRSRECLLQEIAASPQSLPGKTFSYNNLAYSFVEIIITKLLQQSFDQIVAERIFQPLGMTRATIGYQAFTAQQNKAWPHRFNKKNQLQSYSQYSRGYHQAACSSGGMNANIRDMAAFLTAQMQGIPGILTADDLALFQASLAEAPDAKEWMKGILQGDFASYYGLGWRIIETPQNRIVFHGGRLNGFTNFLGFSPRQKVGIVILHNGETIFAMKTGMKFLSALD